jgi:hypothetical protein
MADIVTELRFSFSVQVPTPCSCYDEISTNACPTRVFPANWQPSKFQTRWVLPKMENLSQDFHHPQTRKMLNKQLTPLSCDNVIHTPDTLFDFCTADFNSSLFWQVLKTAGGKVAILILSPILLTNLHTL